MVDDERPTPGTGDDPAAEAARPDAPDAPAPLAPTTWPDPAISATTDPPTAPAWPDPAAGGTGGPPGWAPAVPPATLPPDPASSGPGWASVPPPVAPTPGIDQLDPNLATWQSSPPPPARRSRFGRRLIIPVVVVAVIVGGVVLRPYLSGNAGELKAGDCFDDPITAGQGGEVKDVQHHPCSEPHLYEAMDTFKFPADTNATFPGSTGFDSFIADKCAASFLAYVGIAAADSSLGFSAYLPTATGWSSGDRDVTCFIGAVDGSKLTGSVKGAKR